MPNLRVNSPDWTVQPVRSTRGTKRSSVDPRDLPPQFLTDDSEIADEFTATPTPATREAGAAPGPLDVSYDLQPGEAAILVVRHRSKALTFHRPLEVRNRSRGGPSQVRFTVYVPSSAAGSETRGVADRLIKAFIVKVLQYAGDKLVSLALTKLVAELEAAVWRRKGLQEGWLQVDPGKLSGLPLSPGRPSSADRSLLLIHGTFSNTAAAYEQLAKSDFFARVKGLYDDRIFGFDHFTLSRTPEENARDLLNALPTRTTTFDVITHSRGGLVLRNVVERAARFDTLAARFKLGRAVLVASPNEGTPLATPSRWENTVGWMANILELFPDNPFTTGAEFVANGIVWMARHAAGDLPGLRAMDGDGELIADLQQSSGPPTEAYSALVANHNPSDDMLQRLIDCGVDQFFGSANDLVVPSEGGWRINRAGTSFIPGSRIGCFGPGGNLPGDSVSHVNFFSQPATVAFLINALAGKAQPLTLIDPARSLPDRRLLRAGGAGISAPVPGAGHPPAGLRKRWRGEHQGGSAVVEDPNAKPLRLTIVNGDLTFERLPLMLGHYQATKLSGAERVINKLIGGTMERALELGDYPTEVTTHQIFLNHHIASGRPWITPRPHAVIVVGLGQEGALQGADLMHTVQQGVIAWARHVVEDRERARLPRAELSSAFDLASTLIGSGGTGIVAGQAAQLIAQGVHQANELLRAAAPIRDGQTWPQVGGLRIVELYLDRASDAWRALKMHEAATQGRYELAPVIERGTGPLPRPLDSGYRGADYDFITAETRTRPNGEVEIAYALDTQRARTEIRALAPQAALVRHIVQTASSDQNDDRQIGRTLFKMLMPRDLDSFLAGSTEMQIEVDSGTAGIPWELLEDSDERRGGRDPWAIRTKLLRKLRTETFRKRVRDAEGDSHALVIGEPRCPPNYARLPAAYQEAIEVHQQLAAGIFKTRARIVAGKDSWHDGPDARAVINALLERDWRVIHIAGHGALAADGGAGGVVLSEGFLSAAEINAMRTVPELVFVNCCYLAASPNESVLAASTSNPSLYDRVLFASGLARALIDIGVRCVVAAGWAVNDHAARVFARTFYDELLGGQRRFIDAVAAARCQARAIDANTWAAYQCYGDPDWRIHRDAVALPPREPEQEFEGVTSVAMLTLALETLIVRKTYQGHDDAPLLKSVGFLEGRYREANWTAGDGVGELFARIYAALNDFESAIRWYDEAIAVSNGNTSLKAIEQRANLRARQAWARVDAAREQPARRGSGQRTKTRAAQSSRQRKNARVFKEAVDEARVTIVETKNVLNHLMTAGRPETASATRFTPAGNDATAFRQTAERANLCGSAMKRLAQVEAVAGRTREEVRAIEEMKRYYRLGLDISDREKLSNRYYPACNCIAAELALHAGQAGWRLAERSLFATARSSLNAQNQSDPDFWSVVGAIELDLYEAIAEQTVAAKRGEIKERYDDLYHRMRSAADWSSVYDTAAFVLVRYRQRSAGAEGNAAADLLSMLKGFVPTQTPSDKPVRRRKRRDAKS
jgi:hypothetical protein